MESAATVRDLVYQERTGGAGAARLYQPAGPGPFPAVVDVHGGAWTSGDRLSNAAIDGALAAAGILVLALDFRMPPEGIYPDPVADVNLGIRWLKAHAAELGTRPELVGALGTSSGGNTMLLAVLRPHDPRYAALPLAGAPEVDATVAYAIACWPITDPLARYRMARNTGNERLVTSHDAYWQSEERMREGNPQLLLERGEPAVLPPLYVAQGTNDDNVTPDMADRFAAAYSAAGGAIRLEKFPGQPHSFIKDAAAPEAARALASIVRFITERAGIVILP